MLLEDGLWIEEVAPDEYEPIIIDSPHNSSHNICLKNHVSWHDFEESGSFKNNFYPIILFLTVNWLLWKHCLLKGACSKMIFKLWSSHTPYDYLNWEKSLGMELLIKLVSGSKTQEM